MNQQVVRPTLTQIWLKLSSAIALSAVLAACGSSAKKVDLGAGANPQTELQRLDTEINQAREKQYDVMAPGHYKEAVEARDEAREKIADSKSSAKVIEQISIGFGHVEAMKAVGQKNEATFQPILAARSSALAAKANELDKKEFENVDEDFADIGKSLEKDNYRLDAKEVARLETRYMESELKAVKAFHLGETKALIEKAESDGANRSAPKTHQVALTQYAAADSAIEAARRSPEAFKAQVDKAVAEGKKLNAVLALTKENKVNEDAAVRMWDQQQTIAGQQTALNNSQASINQLQQNVTQEKSEKMKLEQTNQEMASQQAILAKIEEFKKNFRKDEAEVLQDGSKYIVRLRNMKFASNRSDLPGKSLETLKKVSELISIMPAKAVMVEGHTDSVGTAQVNQKLSEERASTVKSYFVQEGILDSAKINSEGFGFQKPLTTNKTKEGRATNRRVDVVIETTSL